MKEEFAKFLLSKGYFLTALEFYQEMLEDDGTEIQELVDHFNAVMSMPSTQDPIRVIKERKKQQASPPLKQAESEAIRSRDDKISLLEYELRQSREDIKELKEQIKRNKQTPVVSANEIKVISAQSATSKDMGGAVQSVDQVSKDKIKPHEKKILNYLFRKYLTANNYPLTSVTFSEESQDNARNWSDLQMNQAEPPSLLTIYRYFFENGDSGVQGVLTKTMGEITKLKKEISDSEVHWRQLQKERDDLAQKNKDYEAIIVHLKKNQNQLTSSTSAAFVDKAVSSSSSSSSTSSTITQAQKQQQRASTDENLSTMRKTYRTLVEKRRQTVAFQIVSNDDESEASMRIAEEVEKLRSHGSDQLNKIVSVIASSLPHILPGVLLDKRQELIPLILIVISNHPEETTRFSLTKLLFNLVKKPNEFQRHAIMKGCMALASIIGPQRTETEILSQCWEQLSEKHPERRVLVADSCGCLAQFASSDLRLSLILSILQQLGQDKSPLVRVAVTKNFSLLINFFDTNDKYNQVEESFKALLYDSEPEVSTATRTHFLPSLANWTDLLEALNPKLTTMLLSEMYGTLHKYANQKEEFKIPEQDVIKIQHLVACFIDIIPRIHQSMISSSPLITEKDAKIIELEYDRQEALYQYQLNENRMKQHQNTSDLNNNNNNGTTSGSINNNIGRTTDDSSASSSSSSTSSFSSITNSSIRMSILGKQEVAKLHAQFDQYLLSLVTNDMSSTKWPALEWLCTEFITRLLSIIYCIPMRNSRLIFSFSKALNTLCMEFGHVFTKRIVNNAFYKELQKDNRTTQPKKYRLLPFFTAGVLTSLESAELNTFLSDIIVQISIEERGWDHSHIPSLVKCIELLCGNDIDKKKEIGDVLSNLTSNPSNQVRSCILNLYKVIMPVFNAQQIANSIVPSMITLSTDPDRPVRIVCIGALSIALAQINDDSVLEKIAIAFERILDDKNHMIEVEFVQSISKVIPTAKSRYRDSFILPKIVEFVRRNSNNPSNENRKEMSQCLFDALRAFMSVSNLPKDLIQEQILPSLKVLQNDSHLHDPSFKSMVFSMINDVETAIKDDLRSQTKKNAAKPAATTTTTSPLDKMSNLTNWAWKKDPSSK